MSSCSVRSGEFGGREIEAEISLSWYLADMVGSLYPSLSRYRRRYTKREPTSFVRRGGAPYTIYEIWVFWKNKGSRLAGSLARDMALALTRTSM